MAISVCFSDFFIHIFFRKLHFITKKFTIKPTWEMNQLIDHCIDAQEFRYLPHYCCVKIARTSGDYFWRSIHFFTKNSDRKEGICLFDINNHNTEYSSVKILSGDSH